MFARIRDLIFGYDICFLYAGNQFSGYVDALANHLSHDNFRCYLEHVEGLDFKNKVVGNAINSSTLLVVMATEEGVHSEFIEKTIDIFIRNRKKVIAIDVGFLKESQWYYLLKNQKKIAEKPSFLESGKPSNAVFDVVVNTATFRVKNKILKQSNLVSAVLVITSIFFMLGASYYIYYLSDQLTTNRELVNESQLTVTKEQENARLAIEEAGKRQNEASIQGKLAIATKMAVESNNSYISDPTKAMRFAETGYLNFDTANGSPPASVLSSMFDSFYQSYLLKYAFYKKNIAFNSAVNDFQEIDGVKKLLVANDDGKIRIVSDNGETEATFDAHERKVNKVTYSPTNQFILTTSDDNTANLLTINGELIKTLPGHQDDITLGMISPKGDRLLTVTDDSLRLWDNRGNLISTLGEEDKIINYAVFSPVEGIVATVFDNQVKLLDFKGNVRREFTGHTDEIISLSYSVNGSRIATASYDSTAIIWSKGGQIIGRLNGHNGIVNAAYFSPDRTKVITVSDDQTAKLWTWDGQFIKTMAGHTDAVVAAEFSPNSLHILTVSLDNTVRVWDNRGNHLQTLKGHLSTITKSEFSSDSKTITTSAKDGTIKTWPVAPELLVSMDLHAQGVQDVFYGPEGKNIWTISGRGLIRIWNEEGKLSNANFAKGAFANQILMKGKGGFFGLFDGQVKQMNASGKFTRQWNQLGRENMRIAASVDRNKIAVLAGDSVVKALPNAGDTIVTFRDSTLVINDMLYNSEKELILATNKGLGKLTDSGTLNWLAFRNQPVSKILPGSKTEQHLLMLGSGQLLLTDNQFEPIQQFSNQFGNITAAVDDHERRLVYAGTEHGNLLVFHYSGELISSAKLHQGSINRLRLSSDKKYLLTAGADNSAKICPTAAGIADWLKTSEIAAIGN